MRREEPIVDFPVPRERVVPATLVRSTLISSSLLSLRDHGFYERYLKALPEKDHEKVLYVAAGTWLRIEVATAHYGACEAMGLAEHEVLTMGNAVAQVTQRSSLAMLLRTARGAGVTPLAFFAQAPKYWSRLFTGGAVATFQLGPKEVRFETVGIPVAKFRYFRAAYGALLKAVVTPFAHTMYVREVPHRGSTSDVAYRFSWV